MIRTNLDPRQIGCIAIVVIFILGYAAGFIVRGCLP